ncbi:MAG TPA: twin-arginine translocation signal domain-containing protein [Bryobacteraceae bacterium]|nr:twin-arginine translocation signal domain-containing protein [Bryobacteraceae bacterium]
MNNTRRQFLQTAALAGAALPTVLRAKDVPTLGMIFPPANYPVPPEATELYPSGIRFLAEGVGLEKMTPEEYDRVGVRILPAAEKLAKQGANAISVMGTSLTFYKGAEYEHQIKVNVTKATGLPSTTMSTGIVEGLKAVNAKKIAVATAYNEDVSHRLRVFLEESGFQVLSVKGLGIVRFEDRKPVTPDELLNFSAGVYEGAPKADALVISCGALKTLELIVPLEKRCKVPVVSSTPHALWASVRLLGVSGQAKGFGTVLAKNLPLNA